METFLKLSKSQCQLVFQAFTSICHMGHRSHMRYRGLHCRKGQTDPIQDSRDLPKYFKNDVKHFKQLANTLSMVRVRHRQIYDINVPHTHRQTHRQTDKLHIPHIPKF